MLCLHFLVKFYYSWYHIESGISKKNLSKFTKKKIESKFSKIFKSKFSKNFSQNFSKNLSQNFQKKQRKSNLTKKWRRGKTFKKNTYILSPIPLKLLITQRIHFLEERYWSLRFGWFVLFTRIIWINWMYRI